MILRQAVTGDAPAICDIANAIIRDTLITFTTEPKTTAGIAADISVAGKAYLVAELDGHVAGFATYSAFRAGPGYARTREVTIHLTPKAQGRGMGRALMVALEQVARRADVHALVAGISAENPAAIGFHAALGFAEVGRLPQVGRKGGRWLDLILMQKILTGRDQGAPDSGATTG